MEALVMPAGAGRPAGAGGLAVAQEGGGPNTPWPGSAWPSYTPRANTPGLTASRAAARTFGSAKGPDRVLRKSPVVRAVGTSRTVGLSRVAAWETGTASAMSASPVRRALVR